MSDSLIGLWWYTDTKELWAQTKLTFSGQKLANCLKYNLMLDHSKVWKKVVKENTSTDADELLILDRGYKTFERGEVFYNIPLDWYEIHCSRRLVLDREFQSKLINYFHLEGQKYTFIHDDKYK